MCVCMCVCACVCVCVWRVHVVCMHACVCVCGCMVNTVNGTFKFIAVGQKMGLYSVLDISIS